MKYSNYALATFASLVLLPFAQAGELPATAVIRSVGDGAENIYVSGYTAPEKGNVGSMPASQVSEAPNGKMTNMWKAYVVFDAVSMLDELAQKPSGELEVAVDWVKSPDDVKDIRVIYIGSFPTIEIRDDIFFEKYSVEGTEVGVIPASELASVKSHTKFTFDIDGVIPSGDVSPVNRYLMFRFESDPTDDVEANGMVGLSPIGASHKLIIGGGEGDEKSATGGY